MLERDSDPMTLSSRASNPAERSEPAPAASGGHAGWLSRRVREQKLTHFMSFVAKDARILDFGCAAGWVGQWARERGWPDIVGVDLVSPADIVGDIHDWRSLGLEPHSFDAIVAFEVVEHGDFARVLHELLRPGGLLLATTPVPRWDWMCQLMERLGVLQERTGPHVNLLDLREYPGFSVVDWRVKGVVAQWGVLTPA